ncbi:MAG: hypothetical protein JXA36_07275 [Coriobacteriia bacterium]|nr:hypothetical protein [Coriobacteriia bacterium]
MSEGSIDNTLADYLGAYGPLPLGKSFALMDYLLQLVGKAHSAGLTDGALSPARLVVDDSGQVELLPAAEARPIEDGGAYLAPEQREGEPAGPGSDVYALGVMAYHMMTGVLPYSAGDDPVDPLALLPNITDHVRRTLTIAVQKDPADRFADALEFRAALRGQSNAALEGRELKWTVPEGASDVAEGDRAE